MAAFVQAEVNAQLRRENEAVEFDFIQDRPYNDLRYYIDISKARDHLGWAPTTSFKHGNHIL